MRAREFLSEASNLGVGELRAIRGGQPRYLKFLEKVKAGSPFTTKDGEPFIVDPKQYKDLQAFFADPTNSGALILKSKDGQLIRASDLRKTTEFGGTQPSFDQTEPKGKEALPAKPSQVFQTTDVGPLDVDAAKAAKQVLDAGAFYASNLYDKIVKSATLKGAGDFGKVVIDLAKQINQGTLPVLEGVDPNYVAAIRDYAGEYLGVLATIKGLAEFPRQEQFYEFLGADSLNDLIIYFPRATNNPLADSIAVQNKVTNQVINISSKGGKKGAPPSLDNLKVPDEFRKKRSFKDVIGLFDVAQQASAKEQPFRIMNYLHSIGVKLPAEYKKVLPFTDEQIDMLVQFMDPKFAPSDATDRLLTKLPKTWKSILAKMPETNATLGGRIHYVVNKDLITLINSGDVIPNFRKLVLEILGYNFVQLFTDIKGKKKQFQVRVLWPAKLDGNVEVYSKSYAAEPGKGKLSFSIT